MKLKCPRCASIIEVDESTPQCFCVWCGASFAPADSSGQATPASTTGDAAGSIPLPESPTRPAATINRSLLVAGGAFLFSGLWLTGSELLMLALAATSPQVADVGLIALSLVPSVGITAAVIVAGLLCYIGWRRAERLGRLVETCLLAGIYGFALWAVSWNVAIHYLPPDDGPLALSLAEVLIGAVLIYLAG